MTDTLTHILFADIDKLKAENEKFYRDFDEIDRFLQDYFNRCVSLDESPNTTFLNLWEIRRAQKSDGI